MNSTSPHWNICIDTGGTFTDCIATDERGAVSRAKVLSSAAIRGSVEQVVSPGRVKVRIAVRAPADFYQGFMFSLLKYSHPPALITSYDPGESVLELSGSPEFHIESGAPFELRSPEEAPILAARLVTGTPMNRSLPPISMRLATTRGTNALLERRGAPTAFFVTKGFGDLLKIGDQQRPDLFALNIRKPDTLYAEVIEVPERTGARGEVLEAVDLETVAENADRLARCGVTCAAVALLHSYINPSHEIAVEDTLRRHGFIHVTRSSAIAPLIKILPRAETTVVNAYLSPVIDDYLALVARSLGDGLLHIMTSAGGLSAPGSYTAKDSLLSGPAGGVVGAARAGKLSGFSRVIAFDMGGTSTDVARFDGKHDYVFEHRVGDARLVAPALAIESVAAGGGSICAFDGVELSVGPGSAGAQPGPACYGAGGPLTLTDANLLLGRLDPGRFDIPIDRDAALRECVGILDTIEESTGQRPVLENLLEGLCEIANERMADTIRGISVRKGYNPAEFAMVAFGGAGGQHACAIASRLGIDTVVMPVDVSLLSALGLGQAVVERFAERQVLAPLEETRPRLPGWLDELAGEATLVLRHEGVEPDRITVRRRMVNLRFAGQDSSLQVEYEDHTPVEQLFESKYRHIFGHWQTGRKIEVESLRVVVSSKHDEEATGAKSNQTRIKKHHPVETGFTPAWFGGGWREVPVFERNNLDPGSHIEGPALVFERFSVTAVETSWVLDVDAAGAMILTMTDEIESPPRLVSGDSGKARTDLVELELFTNRFRSVADEMGEMLRRTAVSTNVKERLDFSCAVLDPDGGLVVNAPHIPVHLGAMGMCVRAVRNKIRMEPGDVVITNHPGFGGSHLPDITVIAPVFTPDGRLLGYVANRAHHAELGGITPGSMPAFARNLAEEGVAIPPTRIFERGQSRWENLRAILTRSDHPTRAVEENLADVRAAVAANRRGIEALVQLAVDHGPDTVLLHMHALQSRAEKKLRQALSLMEDGLYEAEEFLDDGSPLRVQIIIEANRASVGFDGSSGVLNNSFNATPAVTCSAVIYVLRLLVDEPLPLNEGLMNAVTINIPPGLLNPDFPADSTRAPAIVGGNVETSQRLVDTMIKALGLAACSQGTMNNVIFGTERYSYYETVCGGSGAGPGFNGADAVHTHMTNTRITDPEILELRYPVRLRRFAVRRGSGGAGRNHGGNGAVREFEFLEPMNLSVLGQHRTAGPYGLCGGSPGKPARLELVRAGGETVSLHSIDGCDVGPGDVLTLKTPGGGGYGA